MTLKIIAYEDSPMPRERQAIADGSAVGVAFDDNRAFEYPFAIARERRVEDIAEAVRRVLPSDP
jgi:hypothetical protein